MPRARLGRFSKGSRMGKPYSRPSSYRSRQRGAGVVALSKVNTLLNRREIKDFRLVDIGVGQLNAGDITHITPIPQGDLATSRDGNKIYGQYCCLRFRFSQPPVMVSNNTANHFVPPVHIRIIVFKSKSRSNEVVAGGVLSYLDTTGLGGETNILAHKNNNNWLKNKTLHDKTYKLDVNANATAINGYGNRNLNVTLKMRTPGVIEYDSNSITANMGGIFVIILSSVEQANAANAMDYTMSSQFRYVEA